MLEAIERSAARMREAGATVQDVLLPDDFGLTWQAHHIVGMTEQQTFRARLRVDAPEVPMVARDIVASVLPASYYLQAQRIRAYLWTKLQALFADLDVLLMAVAPGAAPHGIESTGDATLLIPWSGLGYPTATVNGGLSPDGLPLGLQLVAAPMADYELMRIGAWCERTLGRLPAPPI
jgi:Asp-tRNA(Asn)/Glu-tRNA(Gln) amidotransferase A subunit family amidase